VSPQRKDLVRMLVIGIVASVVGTWAALQIDWFPTQGSTAAGKIDTLYDWLLVASVPMFVLVMSVAIYCVVRFRVRPGGPTGDGAPIHGNTRLEIVWVTIPFLIVTALAVYAAVVLAQIEKKQPNELQVRAIGQQFTWHFEYTNAGGKKFTTDELYLPNNRPVYMKIDALDVLHSFWVPAFRLKMDAVPGQTDYVRFTPNRPGTYEVVCAELCGLGHATMRVKAAVVSTQAFQKWAQQNRGKTAAGAEPGPGSNPGGGATSGEGGGEPDTSNNAAAAGAEGKKIFTGEGGCGACHALADAGTSGTVGPKLDGIAAKGEAFIKQSIVTPNAKIEKGFPKGVMPEDFESRLGPDKVDALVKYLLEAGK
jgi:cytochrome c oxidase subunit II